MSQKKLPFNIRKNGNKYLFHGRIPKPLLNHPFFGDHNGFYSKTLETDNLREAIRRRDEILATFDTLLSGSKEEEFTAWSKRYRELADKFIEENPQDDDPFSQVSFKDIELDKLLEQAIKRYGRDEQGHPKIVPDEIQLRIDALFGNAKPYRGGLKYTLNKLLKERQARKDSKGSSPKTISKLKRGVEWYLEQVGAKDAQLDSIKWEDVQELVTHMLNRGVAPKTIDGHLYALRTVWGRAFNNNPSRYHANPFINHNVPTSKSKSYDLFTWDEIRDLWVKADEPALKQAVMIGTTTGARINEVATLSTKHIESFGHLCFVIKFKERGKTEHSTRILPVHPKLANELGEGWVYPESDRTLSRKFSELKSLVIKNWIDPYTEQERSLGFHSFRSTVSSYLVNEAGYPETTASGYTGHKPDKKSHSGIITYVKTPDLEKKLEMCLSLPWVFDK